MRFLVASEELFNVVDSSIGRIAMAKTRNYSIAVDDMQLHMLVWSIVCCCRTTTARFDDAVVFVNPSSYLNAHKRDRDSAGDTGSRLKENPKHVDDYIPRSRRVITLDDKLNNIKSIQNVMKIYQI